MRPFILLALLLATSLGVKAQTITSGLQVYVPAFEERFDWSLNYGGNDGLSGIEDYTGATFDRESMTFTDCRHGNHCVEVGASTTPGSIKITLDKAVDAFYTFRVMPYKEKNFYVNIISQKSSIIKKSSFLRGKVSSKKEITISSVNNSGDSHNFYIDDLFLYTASTDYSALTNAERLIVTGTLTDAMVSELQKIVENNTKLTSIDLNSATVSTAFTLEPGNPNCLVFVPKDNYVTNTKNVVKTTTSSTEKFDIINNYECEELVINDGYPFDAMYSFTAKSKLRPQFQKQCKRLHVVGMPAFCRRKSQTGVSAAYAFVEHKNTDDLEFESTEHLEANHPYVIETKVAQPFLNLENVEVVGTTPISSFKCSAGISAPDLKEAVKYLFHGTFAELQNVKSNNSQTIYGFQNGKFVYVGSDDADAVDFKPFRAYFTIANDGAASRELRINGVVNGIEKISTHKNADKTDIFTTEGIRIKSKADSATIGSLPDGIYIIGNKKVMVKH